eukprot:gene8637-8818_t
MAAPGTLSYQEFREALELFVAWWKVHCPEQAAWVWSSVALPVTGQYTIVYHDMYQVPVLFIKAMRPDGLPLDLGQLCLDLPQLQQYQDPGQPSWTFITAAVSDGGGNQARLAGPGGNGLMPLRRLGVQQRSLTAAAVDDWGHGSGLQLLRTRSPGINGSIVWSALCVTDKELQKLVLVQSKARLAGAASIPALDSWRADGDMCSTFVGVTCDPWGGTGLVDTINLPNLGLAGELPPSWAKLTSLATISLHNNQLQRTLPESWGALNFLTAL